MKNFTSVKAGESFFFRLKIIMTIAFTLPLMGYGQEFDPTIGMTNNTGFNTNPDFVQRTINYDKDLGIYLVRMGMDRVGGFNENDPFTWSARDAVVDKYLAEGFRMHCVVAPRAHTNRNTTYEQWKRNFEYFCRNVMARYKGKITYYIIDNEPDLSYGGQIGSAITPAQSVDFTKIAFDVAREIDPAIRIESPPTTSPETSYLRSMISLGVTQFCHYLGVHAYGAQIDDGRLSKPWQYMAEFPQFPQIPVAVSECGTNPDWKPAGAVGLEWQARWFDQFNIALKRYGYDNAILYRLDESGSVWDILSKPAYQAVKKAYRNKPLTNGGFEIPTDLLNPNEWMMIYGVDSANPPTNISVSTADKKAGNNSLRIEASGTTRQVVGKLTPGVPVTVWAWVRATSGGTAKLTLQGYNKTDGDAEQSSSSISDTWTQLSVTVTPTNAFMVVELESTGGICYFDEVIVNGSPIEIVARGTSGTETMELHIDDTMVSSWTLTTTMSTYTFDTNLSSGNIKVYHVNDGPGKDIQIDYIRAGGQIFQAESQMTNTAVWNGTTCGGQQSEFLQCNGYIDFGNRSLAVHPLFLRDPENPANTLSGLYYNYYHGSWSSIPNFNNLTTVKAGTVGKFELSPRIRNDNFSFQFHGYVDIPNDGLYTFYTTSDDGSKLYIGDQEIVDNDGLHAPIERRGIVALRAGKHAIRVAYFEQGGGEVLQVRYSGPGVPKQIIPATALSRAPLPDLIVTDVTWSPANPVPGDQVTFSAVVKNQGEAATPGGLPHGMAFYVNGVKATCSYKSKTSLGVNESRTYTADGCGITWTAGTNPEYEISVFVDDVNRYYESNESNNRFAKTMVMGGAAMASEISSTQSDISYYPNPARNEFAITYQSESSTTVYVTIVNGQGVEVIANKFQAEKGTNTWNVSLQGLKSDIYLVKMRTAQNKVVTHRLVVHQ